MVSSRAWPAIVGLMWLTGMAFAQGPPVGDPKAEYDYWRREEGRGTTLEARQAAGRKALDAARRTGDPERLQTILGDMQSHGLDPTGQLLEQAIELGLRPDASATMRAWAYWFLVPKRLAAADPGGRNPDARTEALRQHIAAATADLGAPPLWAANAWANLSLECIRLGSAVGAERAAERAVALDPEGSSWWLALAAARRHTGDLRGSLNAALAWSARAPADAQFAHSTFKGWQSAFYVLPDSEVGRVTSALGLERPCLPLVRRVLIVAEAGLRFNRRQVGSYLGPHIVHFVRSQCQTAIGSAHGQERQYERAEEWFTEAVRAARLARETAGWEWSAAKEAEAEALEAWAEMLVSQGELRGAEEKLGEASEAREKGGDGERTPFARPYGLYAEVSSGRGKMEEAIAFGQQGLKQAKEADDVAAQAEALVGLAVMYHEAGRSEDGLRAGEKAAELAKQIGTREDDQAARYQLAVLYYDLGDAEEAEAIEAGMRPIRRSRSSDWAAVLRRRAASRHRAGEYAGAIRLLKQAQKIDEMLGRKLALVDDLNGLAACYVGMARAERGVDDGP